MPLRPLLALMARHRAALAGASGLLLLESATALALPWLAGQAAGRLAQGSSAAPVVALLVAAAGLQALLRWATNWAGARTGADLLADLRGQVHDHLQALPLGFHQSRRRGELMALLTHELSHLAGFVSGTLLAALPALLTAAGAIVFMLRIEVRLGLLVAALVPVFYLTVKIAGRRLRPLAIQLQQADADTTAVAEENLMLLPATKAFTREPERSAAYALRVETVRRLSHAGARAYAAMEPILQFAATAAAVLLLWLLGEQITRGEMAPTAWVSFVLYAALLTRPVAHLATLYGQALMARGTLGHLSAVLGEAPEADAPGAAALERGRGEVAFESVDFAYPGRPAVLSGFHLRIGAGEIVALVGPNGAGKSTCMHLLMRFHTPQGGRILLDGQDIDRVQLASLRRQIALVPQHVLLFNASVRENIAFGRPGATPAQIEAAARLAQADAFIRALPQGYDTPIGDEGVRLSGGQRQRLALARALLKDAPVLVLDEPTAMFDPQAEEDFVRALTQERGARTVVLITHRPASLALADRIVRLPPPQPASTR